MTDRWKIYTLLHSLDLWCCVRLSGSISPGDNWQWNHATHLERRHTGGGLGWVLGEISGANDEFYQYHFIIGNSHRFLNVFGQFCPFLSVFNKVCPFHCATFGTSDEIGQQASKPTEYRHFNLVQMGYGTKEALRIYLKLFSRQNRPWILHFLIKFYK